MSSELALQDLKGRSWAYPSEFRRVCRDHSISGLYKCTVYHSSQDLMIAFADFEPSVFDTCQLYA